MEIFLTTKEMAQIMNNNIMLVNDITQEYNRAKPSQFVQKNFHYYILGDIWETRDKY